MNILNLKKEVRVSLLSGSVLMAVLAISFFGIQTAYAQITSQLDLGDTGSEVTSYRHIFQQM